MPPAAILVLALALQAPAAELQPGPWRAELAAPGGALAFGLWFDARSEYQIHDSNGEQRHDLVLSAEVVNGRERRQLASARLQKDELLLRFDPYDAQIRATLDPSGRRMQGTWTKQSAGRSVSLPFRAEAVPPDLPAPPTSLRPRRGANRRLPSTAAGPWTSPPATTRPWASSSADRPTTRGSRARS